MKTQKISIAESGYVVFGMLTIVHLAFGIELASVNLENGLLDPMQAGAAVMVMISVSAFTFLRFCSNWRSIASNPG